MKLKRNNRAFYQKKIPLENVTNSSLQNSFFISTWFDFFKKNNQKKGDGGNPPKLLNSPGCLIGWLGHYVKKMPCLCKIFGETSKGLMLHRDSILTVLMEEKKLIMLKE